RPFRDHGQSQIGGSMLSTSTRGNAASCGPSPGRAKTATFFRIWRKSLIFFYSYCSSIASTATPACCVDFGRANPRPNCPDFGLKMAKSVQQCAHIGRGARVLTCLGGTEEVLTTKGTKGTGITRISKSTTTREQLR